MPADDYSSIPASVCAPPDAFTDVAIRRRLPATAVDPRLLPPTLRPRLAAPFPLPTSMARELMLYRSPLSYDDCIAAYRNGLPGFRVLAEFQRFLAVTERRFWIWVVGIGLYYGTMVALLVAVYVGRGPDGSTSAFATAAVGILFGYVHYPLIALRHHWVTSAPLFSAADSKDLSCAPHAYTARYWTVMGQSKRGVEEGRNGEDSEETRALFGHRAPQNGFELVEPFLEPDSRAASRDAMPGFAKSDVCPCLRCAGIFDGGGWKTIVVFFLGHFGVHFTLQAVQVALVFWDLWATGSLLYTTAWVPAVLAVNVASFVVFFTWMHGHTSFVLSSMHIGLLGRTQHRVVTAAVDALICSCTDRVRTFLSGETKHDEAPHGAHTAPLYLLCGEDIAAFYRGAQLEAIYVTAPLVLAIWTVAVALLCSFPFGGSCFPAWVPVIVHAGVYISLYNLICLAQANMSVTRLSAEFGRASERIGAALVELASSAGSPPTVQAMTTDPSRAYLFAALSAELAAHRDELRRLATTLPRIKAFGFDLTFSALRTGGLAALTVGAALYQAFRLRIQLGTFCKP